MLIDSPQNPKTPPSSYYSLIRMIGVSKKFVYIYLICEAKTKTLIKAYIQSDLTRRCERVRRRTILTIFCHSSESSGFTFTLE